MNVYSFVGNLGRDAEVRYTPNGAAVCGFSVAVTSGYGDNKKTHWVSCSLWGKQAESGLVEYLKKGQQVSVSGELSTREHDGKTYLEVRCNHVGLVGGRSEGQAPARQQAPQRPAQAAPQQQNKPSGDDFGGVDDAIPF